MVYSSFPDLSKSAQFRNHRLLPMEEAFDVGREGCPACLRCCTCWISSSLQAGQAGMGSQPALDCLPSCVFLWALVLLFTDVAGAAVAVAAAAFIALAVAAALAAVAVAVAAVVANLAVSTAVVAACAGSVQ